MTARVFVSHSSKDRKVADRPCAALESRGVPCWISSRDVKAGENYQAAIFEAIRSARAMVLIFSANANQSAEITEELALASEHRYLRVLPRSRRPPTAASPTKLSHLPVDRSFRGLGARRRDAARSSPPSPREFGDAPTRLRRARLRRRVGAAVGPVIGGGVALVVAAAVGVAVWASRPGAAARNHRSCAQRHVRGRPAAASSARCRSEAGRRRAALADATRLGGPGQRRGRRSISSRRRAIRAARALFTAIGKRRSATLFVVIDDATVLMRTSGSTSRIILRWAHGYVERLNSEKFGGFNDWRVPTIVEAMSLMQPEPQDKDNKIHIAPIFARGVNFVWTTDLTADGKRGWIVYFYDAEAVQERPEFNVWVRAVRCIGKP